MPKDPHKRKKYRRSRRGRRSKEDGSSAEPPSHSTGKKCYRRKQKPGRDSGLLPLVDTLTLASAGLAPVNGDYSYDQDTGVYSRRVESAAKMTAADLSGDTEESLKPKAKAQRTTQSVIYEIEYFDLISKSKARDKHEIEWLEQIVQKHNASATEQSSAGCLRQSLSRAGFWLMTGRIADKSTTVEYLYAANCPFADKLPSRNWFAMAIAPSVVTASGKVPTVRMADTSTTVTESSTEVRDRVLGGRITRGKRRLADDCGDELYRGGFTSTVRDLPAEATHGRVLRMGAVAKVKGSLPIVDTSKLNVISGGQTGVDRAAMDAALKFDIVVSGWMPKGLLAEDGAIDTRKYSAMADTGSADWNVRSEKNVVDSDATLILSIGRHLTDGSKYTQECVCKHQKEFMSVCLKAEVRSRGTDLAHLWMTTETPAVKHSADATDRSMAADSCSKVLKSATEEEVETAADSVMSAVAEADSGSVVVADDTAVCKGTDESADEPMESAKAMATDELIETGTGDVEVGGDEAKEEKTEAAQMADALPEFIDGRTLRVAEWIRTRHIHILNVAGPRLSEQPAVYQRSLEFLSAVFRHFPEGRIPSKSLFDQ